MLKNLLKVTGIAAIAAIVSMFLVYATASASPTNVVLTVSPSTTVTSGDTITFDTTANCDTATCRYQIFVFGPGFARNGTVLGEGQHVVVKTPSALPVGTWTITSKVTNSNGTNGFTQAQTSVKVNAAPVTPPATTPQAPVTTAATTTAAVTTSWTPVPGQQWQWQLSSTPTAAPLKTAYDSGARAFDIDGDGATTATVNAIHALGTNIGAICYIDVGGWEDYRSDAANFPASVKGNNIDGWPSEKWLDVRNITVLKPLMQARVNMCKSKGFDAVEPDLLDGYSNPTGFPITAAQQITYNKMIAQLVHDAGMKVTQKGDTDQAAALQPFFDWTLNEQCAQYNECAPLAAYKNAGKAVWIVEYKTANFQTTACNRGYQFAGQAMMLKNVNLTAPRTPCTVR